MIAIYNTDGDLQCKYNYDAWGNHRIGNARNELIYDSATGVIATGYESHIAILNPIRYRGYYYDTETRLYYLQSRYYDATLCRFLNRDNVNYLEPESIHGLNLYAYCNNNPVMFADPSGNEPKWWNPFSWFDNVSNTLKIIIGAAALAVAIFLTVATGGALLPLMVSFVVGVATSAAIGGLISTVKGESFWDGAYDGFSDGVLWGGIFALVAAAIGAIKYAVKGGQGAMAGTTKMTTIKKEQTFDRFGSEYGKFITDFGTPASKLALPATNSGVKMTLQATKNFRVFMGKVADGFGGTGGGVQYVLRYSIKTLLKKGWLIIV